MAKLKCGRLCAKWPTAACSTGAAWASRQPDLAQAYRDGRLVSIGGGADGGDAGHHRKLEARCPRRRVNMSANHVHPDAQAGGRRRLHPHSTAQCATRSPGHGGRAAPTLLGAAPNVTRACAWSCCAAPAAILRRRRHLDMAAGPHEAGVEPTRSPTLNAQFGELCADARRSTPRRHGGGGRHGDGRRLRPRLRGRRGWRARARSSACLRPRWASCRRRSRPSWSSGSVMPGRACAGRDRRPVDARRR